MSVIQVRVRKAWWRLWNNRSLASVEQDDENALVQVGAFVDEQGRRWQALGWCYHTKAVAALRSELKTIWGYELHIEEVLLNTELPHTLRAELIARGLRPYRHPDFVEAWRATTK